MDRRGCGRNRPKSNVRFKPGIYLAELRKSLKRHRQCCQFSVPDFNTASLKCGAGMLVTELRYPDTLAGGGGGIMSLIS